MELNYSNSSSRDILHLYQSSEGGASDSNVMLLGSTHNITWSNVYVPITSNYEVQIRYRITFTEEPSQYYYSFILVNGVLLDPILYFNDSSNYFAFATGTLPLNAGMNTITFEYNSAWRTSSFNSTFSY